jgi:hypothetical protein
MTDRITEIEARANAATPGPWDVAEIDHKSGDVSVTAGTGDEEDLIITINCEFSETLTGKDAVALGYFIAHTREDVPWLIQRVRELEAELKAAREKCSELNRRCQENESHKVQERYRDEVRDQWQGLLDDANRRAQEDEKEVERIRTECGDLVLQRNAEAESLRRQLREARDANRDLHRLAQKAESTRLLKAEEHERNSTMAQSLNGAMSASLKAERKLLRANAQAKAAKCEFADTFLENAALKARNKLLEEFWAWWKLADRSSRECDSDYVGAWQRWNEALGDPRAAEPKPQEQAPTAAPGQ